MFIPALVLQYNNDQYINGGVSPGTIKLIPTPNSGGFVFGDYWAVPVSDGIVSSLSWVACAPGDTDAPTGQSFHVVRINSTQTRDDWYVLGTSTDYMLASKSNECCESPATEMPTDTDDIAACQVLCNNSDGLAFGVFGLPSPDGGTYTINGYLNDSALPQLTGAAASDLVTALNGNGTWNAIGTWAKTADNLTLTVTSGSAASTPPDVLCVIVTFA